jgi:hypothetical protein
MRRAAALLLAATAAVAPGLGAVAAVVDECASNPDGTLRCLYRSVAPSVGITALCRSARDCRVGYYYGDPEHAIWLDPPPATATLPRPEVTWHTGTFAEIRFDCGPSCTLAYFFEAKRRRVSPPWHGALAVDARRLLVATAEARAIVVRQMFSGREVLTITRDWAPAASLAEAITAIHFDPDGRLSLTWLRGADRAAVTERVSVPSFARSS